MSCRVGREPFLPTSPQAYRGPGTLGAGRGATGLGGTRRLPARQACFPSHAQGTLRFSRPGVLGPDVHPQHPLLCWPRRSRPGPGPNLLVQNLMPPPPRATSVAEGTTCHGLAGQSWSLCS